MKIIFLDVDGVLNNTRTTNTFEDYIFVDDDKIKLLKQIIDATNAKIVLSSSWRKGWRFKDQNPACANEDVRLFKALEYKLKEFDIELMSYTKHLWHRGKEIENWLENWEGEKIESYVILDDMPAEEFISHSTHLIQTDIAEGLTEKQVERAIKMLNS